MREGDPYQQPHRGDICKINLIGKLENGTIVEELTDFTVQVGDVEVVQGIDMVLPLMRVGELAHVTAEPRFAYGSVGLKNEADNDKSIPSNATVSTLVLCHAFLITNNFVFQSNSDHLRSRSSRLQRRRRPRNSSICHKTENRVRFCGRSIVRLHVANVCVVIQ